MKTWTEPGRGRKPCPSCKIYVGVRTTQCQCGHSFSSKKKATKATAPQPKKATKSKKARAPEPEPEERSVTQHFQRYSIITPAGKCPFKIDKLDEDGVRDWIERVQSHGRQHSLHYQPSALRYWANTLFGTFSKEAARAHELINLITGDVNGPVGGAGSVV